MRKARRGLGLGAALTLVAGGLLAMMTPTVASAASGSCTVVGAQVNSTARSHGIGGIIAPAGTSSTCQDPPPPPEPAFNGTPPLLFNGRPPVCSFSPCDFYGLPHNLNHIYELFLPKGIESCILPGETTSGANGQACTVNNEGPAPTGTTAYCAYHSTDLNRAVYANLDYPIYDSATGFTCGSNLTFGVVESPNGNLDADTEVSPLSHETSEAVTDPDTETGWFDSTGNEIGDDCAYIYGATRGTAGALYNQTINGQHFMTQEEFSNRVFARSNGTIGCVQSWLDEFPGA